ncbi:MAG: AAA family ATPase, partial [Gammaproteobacteria bacterium]
AIEAARAVGGLMAVPDFGPDRPEGAKDFNDLARLRGAEAVAGARSPDVAESHPDAEDAHSGFHDGEAVYRRMSDIQPKPIRWLWPGRIARGKVTMLAGHPGLGKSQVMISMAAIVTIGGTWPVDRTPCEWGSVIILSAEDDAEDTIRPRLEAAGADLKRVYILDAIREPNQDGASTKRPFTLTADIDQLKDLAEKLRDVALIVIDPVTAYLGHVDSHRNAEVRAVLAPLAEMAAGVGAAVVCVSHLNKAGGTEAMLRVMGSLGFVAAARGAYLVAKDPEDPGRRLFLPMKNNLAEDRGGLAFRVRGRDLDSGIATSCVEWDAGLVTMTADEALAPAADPEDGETAAKAEAEGWLRETLKGGDSMDGKRLKGLARDSEISVRTLYRAANAIGVVMLSGGFGKPRRWHLCPMPGKGCDVCRDPEDESGPIIITVSSFTQACETALPVFRKGPLFD